LVTVWNAPSTDMRHKERLVQILQILIREIVVDVDETRREVALMIHWVEYSPRCK
jgi:hypothetical protein